MAEEAGQKRLRQRVLSKKETVVKIKRSGNLYKFHLSLWEVVIARASEAGEDFYPSDTT